VTGNSLELCGTFCSRRGSTFLRCSAGLWCVWLIHRTVPTHHIALYCSLVDLITASDASTCQRCLWAANLGHHHHDAKRSAVASHRCDLPPKRSVPSQLESIIHRYSRVPANLMYPCGERSASSAPPVGWWPDAVLSFATGLEDLVYWNIIGESGNVTEQSKPSFGSIMGPKGWYQCHV